MKILFTISLLGTFLIGTHAQSKGTDKVTFYDVGTTFSYTFRQNELSTSPYVSLKFNKHRTQIGPILKVLSEKEVQLIFNGVQVRYGYEVYAVKNKLRLFLQSSLIYQTEKKEGEGQYFDLIESRFKAYDFNTSSIELEIYGGYNLEWQIGEKINLQQSFSYGLIHHKQTLETSLNNALNTANRGSFNIGVGIGYNL